LIKLCQRKKHPHWSETRGYFDEAEEQGRQEEYGARVTRPRFARTTSGLPEYRNHEHIEAAVKQLADTSDGEEGARFANYGSGNMDTNQGSGTQENYLNSGNHTNSGNYTNSGFGNQAKYMQSGSGNQAETMHLGKNKD